MSKLFLTALAILLTGLVCYRAVSPSQAGQAKQPSDNSAVPAELKSDISMLQDKAADQAHAMVSVAYHFNNLWFAAQNANWPLADFYWNETRSHMRWAVRIIPVRKDSAGYDVKLTEILDSVENTPLAKLRTAIDQQDKRAFDAAYNATLEGCYACHKASDKPFLRLKIPTHPAEPMIQFEPGSEGN